MGLCALLVFVDQACDDGSSPDGAQVVALNTVHKRVRAPVEHASAHMKWWNLLRNCRRKRHGVHHATHGIALTCNLAMAG
jgi:hypothetical protein